MLARSLPFASLCFPSLPFPSLPFLSHCHAARSLKRLRNPCRVLKATPPSCTPNVHNKCVTLDAYQPFFHFNSAFESLP